MKRAASGGQDSLKFLEEQNAEAFQQKFILALARDHVDFARLPYTWIHTYDSYRKRAPISAAGVVQEYQATLWPAAMSSAVPLNPTPDYSLVVQ